MKAFLISIVPLLFCACVSFSKGPISAKSKLARFGIAEPNSAWQQKRFRNADIFLEHQSKKAMIFFNSQCERFSDSPLEALRAQMLVGLSEISFLSEKRETYAEREALVSELLAKIDGIQRFLKIMVLRKNACVFDAVYSSLPEDKEGLADFDELLRSFWAEASL